MKLLPLILTVVVGCSLRPHSGYVDASNPTDTNPTDTHVPDATGDQGHPADAPADQSSDIDMGPTTLPDGQTCSADAQCTSGVCSTCFPDRDGDGFGDKWSAASRFCGPCVTGYVADNRDCMDDPVTFSFAAQVNPNAAFPQPNAPVPVTYQPDSRDPAPDPWDWNCDGIRELQYASYVPGCLSGASCTNGCQTAPAVVTGPTSCGEVLTMGNCNNSCPFNCTTEATFTPQQMCR
jgi:hypothetical protein